MIFCRIALLSCRTSLLVACIKVSSNCVNHVFPYLNGLSKLRMIDPTDLYHYPVRVVLIFTFVRFLKCHLKFQTIKQISEKANEANAKIERMASSKHK